MGPELEISLRLMLVGMTTVFLILFIVILSSKLLISIINHYEPVETNTKRNEREQFIPNDIKSVIDKAVHQISGGKAKIEKIQKID